ncbi:tyrosine--tRNA ligase [Candidatus Gracilibacteria bacterium]|nr:tyrosine--tRNA ligase [Candidatus Gracilibacteria bacterium]
MNSQIHNLLNKGVSKLIDADNLTKRLESGDKLVVKFGIDPSGTIVHLGHMVPILKLKQFQEMGHKVILLIGDATAQVGDASDKDAERPMLTRVQTRHNAELFIDKFNKVLDLSKIEIYWNSEGLDAVNFAGVGELAKNFSVAEMLDRDNFSKRYKSGVRISLQEFLYPIMQGYDSVAIARKYGACDLELGGTDQYFNLLAGRTLMDAHGLPKQDIMTFDLLVGSDGKKMSKTSPNTIAIDEAPQSMYQKLINIHDDLIVKYYELATDATLEEVVVVQQRLESGEHPNILKIELAQRVITMYHGKPYDASDIGNIEQQYLSLYFLGRKQMMSSVIFGSTDKVYSSYDDTGKLPENSIFLSDLLKEILFCTTSGDVRNALAGKSVRIDGVVIEDPKYLVTITVDGTLVEMGKKKAKRVFL